MMSFLVILAGVAVPQKEETWFCVLPLRCGERLCEHLKNENQTLHQFWFMYCLGGGRAAEKELRMGLARQ